MTGLTYREPKRWRAAPGLPGAALEIAALESAAYCEKAALVTHLRVRLEADRGRAIDDGGAGDWGIPQAAGIGLRPPRARTRRAGDRLEAGEQAFVMGAEGEHGDRQVFDLFERFYQRTRALSNEHSLDRPRDGSRSSDHQTCELGFCFRESSPSSMTRVVRPAPLSRSHSDRRQRAAAPMVIEPA